MGGFPKIKKGDKLMRSLRLKILSGFGIILLLVVILSAIIITETKQTTELAQEIITEDVEELLLIENLVL